MGVDCIRERYCLKAQNSGFVDFHRMPEISRSLPKMFVDARFIKVAIATDSKLKRATINEAALFFSNMSVNSEVDFDSKLELAGIKSGGRAAVITAIISALVECLNVIDER